MLTRRMVLACVLGAGVPRFVLAQTPDEAPMASDDGWPVVAPTQAGFDPFALEDLSEAINSGPNMPNVHALIIEHQGRLVFERYWPGADYSPQEDRLIPVDHGPDTLHGVRSISKSVTSLVLGIALEGRADDLLMRPITSFLPDRSDLPDGLSAITLHHLLTMTAGLDWNATLLPYDSPRNDFNRLQDASDPIGFVLGKQVVDAPGARWSYNSGLTVLVGAVIEHLTQRPFADYADEVLFRPLGISRYEWFYPPVWRSISYPDLSAGLRLRARDTAKIASLVLHNGAWQGRQIVPSSWITASTRRIVADVPWGPFGYGYYWYPGALVTGERAIIGIGYGDQRIYVLPDLGLTVTLHAGNFEDGGGYLGERIMGRVVRALR